MSNENKIRGMMDESNTCKGDIVQTDWRRYENPVLAIVETVAATKNKEPTDLPPLNEFIDLEALNTILVNSGPEAAGTVSFEYQELQVTASHSGKLSVREPDNQ